MESDYDKIMNPIKKIKLAEQKAGKPAPVFDEIQEPNFPNEAENNKTLEGVDSNRDGVRDDIEIWINRSAENKYVRIALKDNYKANLELYKTIESNLSEDIVASKMENLAQSDMCLITVTTPYKTSYLNQGVHNSELYWINKMETIFLCSPLRTSLMNKHNKMNFTQSIGKDETEKCKALLGNFYVEIFEKNKIKK